MNDKVGKETDEESASMAWPTGEGKLLVMSTFPARPVHKIEMGGVCRDKDIVMTREQRDQGMLRRTVVEHGGL